MKKPNKKTRKSFHDREDLTGEHKYGDAGQLILLILFLIIWITDSFFLHFSDFLNQYVTNFIRIPIALIILGLSGLLAWKGLKLVFVEERKEPHIITEGVFSIVRHPVYLSAILLYLGFIFLSLSLLSVFLWIIIILFYYLISRYEEKLLVNRFGNEYRKYMKQVPMLLPFFKFRR